MRVMRVLTRPNVGGPTMQAIALFHAHRELGVRTLLATGTCAPSEASVDLQAHGIARLDPSEIGPGSEGHVVVEGLGNRRSPFAHWRAVSRLRAMMRTFVPDVVHTHTSAAGLAGRRAAWASGGPKTVHTFHGIVLRDYFGPVASRALLCLEAMLAKRTSALVAVSLSCREELAQLGVAPASRITVIPPAVPFPQLLPRDEARRMLGIPQNAFCVGAYGRLVPIKRTELLFKAMAKIPNALCRVHGDGPERERLLREMPPNCSIDRANLDARRCMAAYDALALPSRREGMPLVAIEAFAAGVPVVGFDVPGVRDALTTWGSGVLVPEAASSQGLAHALRTLAEDPGAARALAQRAAAGTSRFAPAAVARALLDLYASLPST